MGKKRQRVRWSTVDGLKWSGKEGREEQNEDSRIPAPDSETAVVAEQQQQQPEQLMSTGDTTEQNGYNNNNRRQKPVFNGPKQYYNNYGRGEYNYNNYYNHHNGGMNGGGNWVAGYNNGGWMGNDQTLGPRFERRGQGKGRYQPQDSEGSFDTEEMPNGFTKIRSKNLDILFKREYYQHKLRPKEKNENSVECGVAVCQGYGCPGGCTNGCQQVCPTILTTVPIAVTDGESQPTDIATTTDTANDVSENTTTDSEKLQVPAKPRSTGRGSFEHINVSEIAEFKPSSMTAAALHHTPECTADATYYPPPYYQTAAVDPAVSSAATAAANYPTVNVSISDKSPAQATTIPVMSTASYMAPPTAVSATDSTVVRPNLYLYSPADNTLIPCKGVFLTDQGSYYYMASPAPPTGPISAGGSSTGSNGSCTPMPVPPPHHIGYMAAPAATYPHTVLGGGGAVCEGYSDCGSVPYYSSPCMSQCQSSTPQTPNSSGTSTQPASPPLLQSYHPTNWFPSESKIEIEEEPSQQPQANQNDTPTVQYIPGLPVDLMTSKKKKKKKKKVVAEKVLEHRDSLSSDQEQLLVSSLRPQGGVQSGDESNLVSTPPLEQPVVEVVLTDDLADSMVNPPTDQECSDEETLKNTNNTANNNNQVESDTAALVRDDTFTNLNEIQDCEQAANTTTTKDDIHEGSGSETNEHLTDSGIEDNVCNTSSENIQEESEDSKEEDVILNQDPEIVEAMKPETSNEIAAPEQIIETESESAQVESKSVEDIEVVKAEEKEEEKPKDLMAVKETECLSSNTCNNVINDEITDSKIETEVKEMKSDSEILEVVSSNNETETSTTAKPLEPEVETKIEEVPAATIPIANKEPKKRNKNNKSSKKKAQENESSPSTAAVVTAEPEHRVESLAAAPAVVAAEPRMSYSAALRLKESVPSPAAEVVSEPVPTQTKKSQEQISQQSSKSSYNTKSKSKRLPHRTHSDSGRQQNSSRQTRLVSQDSSSRNSPGEWETVPASIAAQPGEWEKKESKNRRKNKKINFEDSVQEAELLDSEVPSLETVSQPSILPPPVRQTRITPSPSPEKDEEPVSAPKPTIKQKPANKNKAKAAKSVKIVEKPATKEASPQLEKEKSLEGEESKKLKNKKKGGSSTNTQDTHTENTHRVIICDNQIEVRFSRCIRRASEVMDMERLEAVKRSGYCDVLLVEKLGSGIFRGSMHLGRLHQGKYVPPDRSDAVLPQEPVQVQDQDLEDDQADLETVEENQDNTLPPLAEEIDLD